MRWKQFWGSFGFTNTHACWTSWDRCKTVTRNQYHWNILSFFRASLEEDIDILYKRLSTSVVVDPDGNCSWLAPVTLLAQCKIKVARFPFDKQECPSEFGSWTYALDEINVTAKKELADIDDFIENGEWKLLEYSLKRDQQNYSNGNTYPSVTFRLRIQRRPLYYTLNLIIPCTLISILAFLSFVLPTNHGERVSLVITVLLAMSVYMLIVSSSLPQTSDAIPVVGKYFLSIIVLTALCLFVTCFVAKVGDYESNIPRWIDRYVNKKLARLLFMESVASDYEEVVKVDNRNIRHNGNSNSIELTAQTLQTLLAERGFQLKLEHANTPDKLSSELAVLADDARRRQNREAKSKKWRRTAEVLDRFFLYIFLLGFLILTCVMFAWNRIVSWTMTFLNKCTGSILVRIWTNGRLKIRSFK